MGYEAMPTPKKFQETVFDAGHRAEEVLHDIYPLYNRQTVATIRVSSSIVIKGHVDGLEHRTRPDLPVVDVREYVVEAKSQSQDEWDMWEKVGWDAPLWQKYKWQVSVYMHAFQAPLHLVRINRATIDSASPQIHHSFVEEPWYSLAELRARVLQVESQALGGVLPSACDSLSFPCPVFYLHEQVDREYIEDEQVDVLAKQYTNAKTVEKIAKAKAEESKKALRVKGAKMETNQTRVTFSERTKLVEVADHKPDEFYQESTWEQVRVTIKKQKGSPEK